MDEKTSLSDKAIQRLREYLLRLGWTAEQILDLIDYITLSSSGNVTLHTKVETEITEGEDENGCN